jgi:hypothetical protein
MALPERLLHNFEMLIAACSAFAKRKGLLIDRKCIAPEIRHLGSPEAIERPNMRLDEIRCAQLGLLDEAQHQADERRLVFCARCSGKTGRKWPRRLPPDAWALQRSTLPVAFMRLRALLRAPSAGARPATLPSPKPGILP